MKKVFLYIITISVVALSSCGDEFLDVNENPLTINEGNFGQQLTQAELNLGTYVSYGGVGLATVLGTIMHHNSSYLGDKYYVPGDDYAVQNGWNIIYVGALMDFEDIINRGEETDNLVFAGIAKLLKAYTYSVLVDVYGDVPFSQACDIVTYEMPVWDDDQEIYTRLFTLVDEGLADISNADAENEFLPGDEDIIYGGNIENWVTFGNSLKLKLYNSVRLVDGMYDAAAVNQLLTGNIFTNVSQDFEIPFLNIQTPESRNPGYRQYNEAADKYDISPWFYEIMVGANPNIHTGIVDPRIPYYWYNPRSDGAEPENVPEYRNGDFISTIFCSEGTNKNAFINNSITKMGIYPIGGLFDEGTGGDVSLNAVNSGTGQAPVRLLGVHDILYIRAELALTGKTSEDPRALLESAISASIEKVDDVVAGSGTNQNVPVLTGSQEAIDYVAAIMAEYDAADAAGKLEILMTQKWIAHFGAPVESYADYRRTGYPVLYDPNTDILQFGPEGHADYTSVSRNFPYSFPWPTNDIDLNLNAPEQKLPGTPDAKVFWDKD